MIPPELTVRFAPAAPSATLLLSARTPSFARRVEIVLAVPPVRVSELAPIFASDTSAPEMAPLIVRALNESTVELALTTTGPPQLLAIREGTTSPARKVPPASVSVSLAMVTFPVGGPSVKVPLGFTRVSAAAPVVPRAPALRALSDPSETMMRPLNAELLAVSAAPPVPTLVSVDDPVIAPLTINRLAELPIDAVLASVTGPLQVLAPDRLFSAPMLPSPVPRMLRDSATVTPVL